jgi:hypothetical protein
VAAAVAAVARRPGFAAAAALDAAAVVLARAGERRAVDDVVAIASRRAPSVPPVEVPATILAVAAVEGRLLRAGALLPGGLPDGWRGQPVEAHGLVGGPASRVSFALRWHGEHPAVLWEVEGEPLTLSAPAVDAGWTTDERSGETLWHGRARPNVSAR